MNLRKYSYFSSLSDGALLALSRKISISRFPAGTEIVREGEVGNFFYFVKQGRLEVTKRTKTGEEAKLSVIDSGQGFGEMALLTCAVRSSTVRALTDVVLYDLAKKDFEDVVLHESAFRDMIEKKALDYVAYNAIKTLQPFALLDADKMYALQEKMVEMAFSAGETIINQGDKGDFYYIVKSGGVAVSKKGKREQEDDLVAMLSAGDGFGEEALIRDDPRNATCRAFTETTVYALAKADFARIMKTSFLENAFPEEISLDAYRRDYVVIDARVPPEYVEEHIEGAINVPVETLRQKCAEFDPTKEYLTYCTNDARGMVAAFLLKSRGFKAKCLRGGVSGWMGPVVTGNDGVYMPEA